MNICGKFHVNNCTNWYICFLKFEFKWYIDNGPSSQIPYSGGILDVLKKNKKTRFYLNIFRLCNIGYPSENHLELESREIWFVQNTRLSCPIVLKFCTENGITTVKLQIDWVTQSDVMGKRNFTRFGFKMSFGQISYIAQPHWILFSELFLRCM